MSDLSSLVRMSEEEAKNEFKESILLEHDCVQMLKNPYISRSEKRRQILLDDIEYQSIKREYLKLYLWGKE